MSGPRQHFRLSDGRVASVPVENVQAQQARWKQQGLIAEALSPEQAQEAQTQSIAHSRMKEEALRGAPLAETVTRPEAITRDVGQALTAGQGVKGRAAWQTFGNWLASKAGGSLAGVTAETQGRGIDAPLKGYEDYKAEGRTRLASGRRNFPVSTAVGHLAGDVVLASAVPQARAAEGASMLKMAGAGATNAAADTGLAMANASGEAAPGQEWAAAKRAALPAAVISGVLRGTPVAATGASRVAGTMAGATLPAETAAAARRLTAPTAAGAEARAAAREGAQSLDPHIRRMANAIDAAEEHMDPVINAARSPLYKREDIIAGMRNDLAESGAGGVQIPKHDKLPSVPEIEGQETIGGGRVGPTAATVPPPRKRGAPAETEHMPATKASPPPPAGFDPRYTVERAGRTLEGLQNELDGMLKRPAEMTPQANGALRRLRDRVQAVRDRKPPSAGADHVTEAADIFLDVDQIKRSVGQTNTVLRKDPQIQRQLRDAYERTLRPFLEDASTWGATAAREQTEYNARWHPWLNERPVYQSTVLAAQSHKPSTSAANFEQRIPVADRGKVKTLIEEAGTAVNEPRERSLKAGLTTSRDMIAKLAGSASATPELKASAQSAIDAIDTALAEHERSAGARVQAREAADVAKAAPMIGKGVNVASAVEHAVESTPVLRGTRDAVTARAGSGQSVLSSVRTAAAAGQGRRSAGDTAVDYALQDPEYGPLLATKKPDDRAFIIATLSQRDPAFRERQRAAAAKQK